MALISPLLLLGGLALVLVASFAGYWVFIKPNFNISKKDKPKPQPRPREPTVEITIDNAPNKVEYQIEKPTGALAVIVKRGKMNKKKKMRFWDKRGYFPNHILREDIGDDKKAKYRFFYRWNYYWSEGLENMSDTTPKYSDELENLAMNDMVLDLKKALGVIASFVLNREIIILLLITLTFSAPIGLPIIENLHLYPPTIVHWVTRR